jgi:hypothetical protein
MTTQQIREELISILDTLTISKDESLAIYELKKLIETLQECE